MHRPAPSHTFVPPQEVPRGWFAIATQEGAARGPPGQRRSPIAQGLAGAHAPPGVHVGATHVPLPSHTPVLQGVPRGRFAAGAHAMGPALPEGHETVPARHSVPAGVHDAPTTQRGAPQVPAPSHTFAPPQEVPAGAGRVIPQDIASNGPAGHAVVPVRHGIPGGLQGRSAAHVGARHIPAPSHTFVPPQGAPTDTAGPRAHTVGPSAPIGHCVLPCQHGPSGETQGCPGVHRMGGRHAPLAHRPPPSHGVPSGCWA
jgi:hypothetical protein